MATETEEQKVLLHTLAGEAAQLESLQQMVDVTRKRVWDLMVQAKNLRVSSYKIAEVVNLSQPRVMQIIKEEAEGPTPKEPRKPSQKKLLEEVARLQQELQDTQEKLQVKEDNDVATVANTGVSLKSPDPPGATEG